MRAKQIQRKPRGRPPKNIKYIQSPTTLSMDYIKKIDELKMDGNLSDNWRIFWQNFKIFATAIDLQKKEEAVQVAIFLNAIGPEAVEVFNSFNLSEAEKRQYTTVTQAFVEFCKPKCNELYESYLFHNRMQAQGEPFDSFLMDIKKIVRRCGFADEQRMIRDRIVLGTNDKRLQKKLLDMANLTMDNAIDISRTAEATKQQAATMQSGETVDLVKQLYVSEKKELYQKQRKCEYCGRIHYRRECPAYGKTCNKCKRKNHFSNVCKAKSTITSAHEVRIERANDSSDSDFYIDTIRKKHDFRMWHECILIQNVKIYFKLDTGAMVNILPLAEAQKLKSVKFEKSAENLIAYNGSHINHLGCVQLTCHIKNLCKNITFFVVNNDNCVPILGLDACVSLGLIKRVNEISLNKKEDIRSLFKEVFEGLGCMRNNFSLHLKENCVPSAKPASRVPLALREPLKNELERLCEKNIIEKTEKPSTWISNIVIVEKSNKKLRICINPKDLNEAIQDKYYEIPTFEQIKAKLSNKFFFTVFDLKDGFWQIALDDKSKELCTFSTPFGCYRFKRLPFGIKIAPEAFQEINENIFGNIKNVIIYIDDILIAAETEKDHDIAVEAVLQKAKEKNVKINWEKIQWKQSEVLFLGHRISGTGIGIDKARLKGIEDLRPPKTKKDLQRLLGFINYMREFIPNLSELSTPLRELIKDGILFEWLPAHEKCLDLIKEKIVHAPILKPFSEHEKIVIQTDASKSGLGCALLQNKRPVCFASRSLNDAETRYAQIEKEMLAVVFACKKFHNYIYGRKIEIVTDHKPLLGIMKKDYKKIPSAKLQRMKLKLEKYNLDFSYLPGKFLYLADLMSRSFCEKNKKEDEIHGLDEMVHSINVSNEKKDLFKRETVQDDILKLIVEYCQNGWPKDKSKLDSKLNLAWNIKNNLQIEDGIVFFDDRIYVPSSLRRTILNNLHKAHLGLEKTKKRAKQLLYWPNLNADIECLITKCSVCQKYRSANIKEPLLNHDVPKSPYEKIGMDVLQVNGNEYLAVGDYFSKYLDIIPLVKKTAKAITGKLDILFATHGFPLTIIADNVPFDSFEFKQWAKRLDITVITVSPRYPKSNGFAERMVQIAKKLILKCTDEKSNIWHALLEYRNTPIKNSTLSPAELLLGRKTRTFVPGRDKLFKNSAICDKVVPVLKLNNGINKKYYDKNAKTKAEFKKGDKVWIKENKTWSPGEVIAKHESPRSYIISKDGQEYRRNSYFLRKRN